METIKSPGEALPVSLVDEYLADSKVTCKSCPLYKDCSPNWKKITTSTVFSDNKSQYKGERVFVEGKSAGSERCILSKDKGYTLIEY